MRNAYKNLARKLNGRDKMENTGVGGKILEWILEK
jgi:hypothetical protein